jgi:hypothetical protein
MHLLKGNVSLVTHPKPVEPKADQHMSFPSSVRPMARAQNWLYLSLKNFIRTIKQELSINTQFVNPLLPISWFSVLQCH